MATTNGWYSGPNDASYVTNMTYTYSPVTGVSYPLTNSAHSRVLRLNTEGDTLTNDVANGTFTGGTIWLDTMVQFVPSEDLPTTLTNDNTIKAAVLAYASETSTNLVVYHGTYAAGVGASNRTFTTTSKVIDPGAWYRLTVAMAGVTSDNTWEAFQVRVDGVLLTNSAAYGDDWNDVFTTTGPSANGTWFLTAGRGIGGNSGAPTEIQSLGFQGTGYLDDLVVTNADPFYVAPPLGENFLITQVIGAHGGADPDETSITIAAGGTTTIVYTAAQWYRIAALDVNGTPVAEAAGTNEYAWTIANADKNYSNNVSFKALGSYSNAYETWFIANGWTEAEIAAGDTDGIPLDTEYLLNTDPTD
ncbi:MAG: hypothetical protein PHR35_05980, partial [Kiritimatiellae bacterium]|nr:hypothetical protein [Kiritimatiellia bacterium]